MMSATTCTLDVRIALPADWSQLDPRDSAAVDVAVSRLREQGSRELHSPGLDEAALQSLSEGVRSTFNAIAIDDVVMCAWWGQMARDRDRVVGLFAGACFGMSQTTQLATSTERLSALTLMAGGGADPGTTRQLVELSNRPCLRVARNWEVGAATSERTTNLAMVQYLVPIDEAPCLGVLTCVTPSLGYLDRLEPVFDSIAQTLTVATAGIGTGHPGYPE